VQVLWFLGRALLVAVLALLLVRFVPKLAARPGKAVTEHVVIAGALGLLTLVVTLSLLLFMLVAMGIGYIPIAGPVALIIGAAVGLGAVLVTRMGTRTYAPGKVSVAVVGDDQPVVTPADPVTR
jgi:hypothetical protein